MARGERFSFFKRPDIPEGSLIESWLHDHFEEVVDSQRVAALMAFLSQYFWQREIFSIISGVFDVNYYYLMGAFYPDFDKEDFLWLVTKLHEDEFSEAKLGLEKFSVFIADSLERASLEPRYAPLVDFVCEQVTQPVKLESEEFKALARLLFQKTDLVFQKTDLETMSLVLWSLFGWNRYLIEYYVNPANQSFA